MHLRILGTRGNIAASAPGYSKHSGVLIDNRLLLDVGEKEYLKYRPRWVFITHLHPDHMALAAADIPKSVSVYSPEYSLAIPSAEIVSRPVAAGRYKVIPVPTVHSHRVRSVGYIVQTQAHKILYSSDIVRIEPRYHRLLRGLDLVITEGSYIRRGGLVRVASTGAPFGHTGIPDLVEFFRRFTRCIIITHFGTWFFKDISRSRQKIESFGKDTRVIPAYDGMGLCT